MAAKPEKKASLFTVDDTGNQFADLDSFFKSEAGKQELKDTARALVKKNIPGLPDEESLAQEPVPTQHHG